MAHWIDGAGGVDEYWCAGYAGAFDCYNPPIPDGTAENYTRIYGRNHGSCSIGEGIWQVPDPAKVTQLFGGHGTGCVFSLKGSKFVELSCLEFTSHATCSRLQGPPGLLEPCSTDYPISDYTGSGLCTDPNTSNIHLQDLWSHGNSNGFFGPITGELTFDNIRLGYNSECGWEFDDGQHPNVGGVVSGSHLSIEFSGCYEEFPSTSNFPAKYCWDMDHGGYGDAMGTPDGTMNFTCDQCKAMFNTQDGFDFAHNPKASITFTRSLGYANMGSNFKIAAGPYLSNKE